MQERSTREKILKNIRNALIHQRSEPFPNIDWDKSVYAESGVSLEETFAKEFKSIGGHFVFCEDEVDFLDQLVELSVQSNWKKIICLEKEIGDQLDKIDFPYLKEAKNFEEGTVAITSCEALVARLGSVIVSSKKESGRRLVVVPTTHIVRAYASQLVPDLKDALNHIKDKYGSQLPSYIACLAGPSRTADIEKTLVTPAHGPKDIFVFLIDDSADSDNS